MSKAEEYSFNIPSELFQQLTKEQQVLWRKEIENTFNNGYQQAEKDLELTWEDIKAIDKLLNQCVDYSNPYQEVLKRFKTKKNVEQEV